MCFGCVGRCWCWVVFTCVYCDFVLFTDLVYAGKFGLMQIWVACSYWNNPIQWLERDAIKVCSARFVMVRQSVFHLVLPIANYRILPFCTYFMRIHASACYWKSTIIIEVIFKVHGSFYQCSSKTYFKFNSFQTISNVFRIRFHRWESDNCR